MIKSSSRLVRAPSPPRLCDACRRRRNLAPPPPAGSGGGRTDSRSRWNAFPEPCTCAPTATSSRPNSSTSRNSWARILSASEAPAPAAPGCFFSFFKLASVWATVWRRSAATSLNLSETASAVACTSTLRAPASSWAFRPSRNSRKGPRMPGTYWLGCEGMGRFVMRYVAMMPRMNFSPSLHFSDTPAATCCRRSRCRASSWAAASSRAARRWPAPPSSSAGPVADRVSVQTSRYRPLRKRAKRPASECAAREPSAPALRGPPPSCIHAVYRETSCRHSRNSLSAKAGRKTSGLTTFSMLASRASEALSDHSPPPPATPAARAVSKAPAIS